MRISDWSSDVCSSDLVELRRREGLRAAWPERLGALSEELTVAASQDDHVAMIDAARRRALGEAERLEERRVRKECVSTCRSRASPAQTKKKRSVDKNIVQSVNTK